MKYISSYTKLANFGRELLDRTSLEQGLPIIADYAKDVIGAERCSIYIYRAAHNILWTTLADGVEKLVVDADKGIVGACIKEKKPVLVNAPYNDPRFNQEIDHKTGYLTKNVACVPIFNSTRQIIGVFQLLNKKEGEFDRDDANFMIFFAHFISGYLELASFFREDEEFLNRI